MSHILIGATPMPGHVHPMLAIASDLQKRGHIVTFTTSSVFRQDIEASGLRFARLLGNADYDHRALENEFPARSVASPGFERFVYDWKHIFADPILDQHRTVERLLDRTEIDLILVDSTFMGVFPLLLKSDAIRPPVITCGVTPLFLTSRDRPPLGVPEGGEDRFYLEEHREFQAELQPVQDHLNQLLIGAGLDSLNHFFLDEIHALPECFLQLTGESFEYPCSDLPSKIRFAGPITPIPLAQVGEPDWWPVLNAAKPVVMVTQGTIANEDLTDLVQPTLEALAHEDVIVIAALGTAEHRHLSFHVPENTIVAPLIPMDLLMPRVSVLVTNGGYGTIQQALLSGVPSVVAGVTEDKPFVAARVEWSGSGINLRTDRPSIASLRAAIQSVLRDDRYWANARRVSTDFAQYRALDFVADEVDRQVRLSLEKQVLRRPANESV